VKDSRLDRPLDAFILALTTKFLEHEITALTSPDGACRALNDGRNEKTLLPIAPFRNVLCRSWILSHPTYHQLSPKEVRKPSSWNKATVYELFPSFYGMT
jgi:hypothetical protein